MGSYESITCYVKRPKIVYIFILTKLKNINHYFTLMYSIYVHIGAHNSGLSRYSTFQYPDQNAYQYPYAKDCNADTLFHVSVSVKRICQFLPYFKQCLDKIVVDHMTM